MTPEVSDSIEPELMSSEVRDTIRYGQVTPSKSLHLLCRHSLLKCHRVLAQAIVQLILQNRRFWKSEWNS
jgi:hypothetical protein